MSNNINSQYSMPLNKIKCHFNRALVHQHTLQSLAYKRGVPRSYCTTTAPLHLCVERANEWVLQLLCRCQRGAGWADAQRSDFLSKIVAYTSSRQQHPGNYSPRGGYGGCETWFSTEVNSQTGCLI